MAVAHNPSPPRKLSLAEFKTWIATCESPRDMSEGDIEALFNSVDVDGTGESVSTL